MPFIRSISGLRATEESLPEEIINKYIKSFDEYLPDGSVVIGRDGRQSGEFIQNVLINSLSVSGRKVYILGAVPTPTVQLLVELLGAAGGIAITASHNPSEWNGLKFINAKGQFLDFEENQAFWKIVDNDNYQYRINESGVIEKIDFAIDAHIDSIIHLPVFAKTKYLESIIKKQYKIVVDAVNASGSYAIPKLLNKFGCTVIPLYCDGSGIFPHTPEPLPVNLGELASAVKVHNADIGIAVDPDADRLVLIDENGEPIGEEKTIVLATEAVLQSFSLFENFRVPVVVVNHSTTRLVEDIAAKYYAKVFRSAVGEINVVKKMLDEGAVIGGEGSGGVILPDCHYGRDSLAGTALILVLMAIKNMYLSEIISTYPKYEMLKKKYDFEDNLDNYKESIKAAFPGDEFNDEDGLKTIKTQSWVQVRQSNTEPIIRIIAEAPDKAEAMEMIERIERLIK